MTTNREVRSFLNFIAKRKYGQSYHSLSDTKAHKVRVRAARAVRIGR